VNLKLVAKLLGLLAILVGLSMSLSLPWAFVADTVPTDVAPSPMEVESGVWGLVASMAICLAVGGLLRWLGRGAPSQLYQKEALAVVGLGWLLCGVLGSLPFLLSGTISDVPGALFESISGFTTTGASMMAHPSRVVPPILFWRSFTHWLGGMGIIVLFVALLGNLGAGAKHLFHREAPGPRGAALMPRIRHAALVLWLIYVGLTVAETGLLYLQGLSLFESLCHTFGTLATGGFSTRDASIGEFQSLPIELIIIAFMILAGTNFTLFYAGLKGRWRDWLRNTEWRTYLTLLVVATAVVWGCLVWQGPVKAVGTALRQAAFQVVAIMTTTGYGTADFDQWPALVQWLLLGLMFVGGSAGSTGGGVKVIRFILFAKVLWLELERAFRPAVVRPVRVGGMVVPSEQRRDVLVYFSLILTITVMATVALSALEPSLDLRTSASAVVATLNNIGPGLGQVGATQNYGLMHAPAKLLLSILMVLGRLELFAVLVLLYPKFWRSG